MPPASDAPGTKGAGVCWCLERGNFHILAEFSQLEQVGAEYVM